jgi:hypothetical protein
LSSESKALVLIFILSIALVIGVMPVRAKNTISKDFGQSSYNAILPAFNATGQELFAYNVTITIETEPSGQWVINKTYNISWSITLTYLDTSIFNSSTFYINFYGADPFGTPQVGGPEFYGGTLSPIIGGNLSQQEPNLLLSENYTTPNAPLTAIIDGTIPYLLYNNGQVVVTPSLNSWEQPSPIDIKIVTTTSTALFTPSTIIAITIVVIIAIVMIYLSLYRRHRKTACLSEKL